VTTRAGCGPAARQFSGLAAIAWRDVVKLLRDRPRLAVNLAFPVLLVLGLGGVLQPTVGRVTGLNAVTLAFTGVLAATAFQSSAAGMISIVEDRETDFARELFIAPVWRLTLVAGKIVGETLVAMTQCACVLAVAAASGVPAPAGRLPALAAACLAACLAGGAFGLATIAALPNQRSAMQVFQFLIIPQYLLGGVIVPLHGTRPALNAIARAMPMRYAVDLTRSAYYAGSPGYREVMAGGPGSDAAVLACLFALLLGGGAMLFSYRERTR
jgi:ABC-2 type transport system permease protein